MGQIEMDLQRSIRQAEELERIAGQLRAMAQNNLDNTLDAVAENWQSDNSNNFCRKGRTIQLNILNTVRNIEQAAGSIRTIAQNTYNAEKRAEEIARRRLYNDGY